MANNGTEMDDIVSKVNRLSVGSGEEVDEVVDVASDKEQEDWGIETDGNDGKGEFIAKSFVARVFARRYCSNKFLQMVFGIKWKFASKQSVRVLLKDDCSTFVGFNFEKSFDGHRVTREGLWHYNGGFVIVEE